MKKYVYLVHGLNDPVEGDNIQFDTKQEAIQLANENVGATVEIVEIEGGVPTGFRLQILGPKSQKAVETSDENHNSCKDADCEVGSEMNPTTEDDIFDKDDFEWEEGYDDRRNHDPINRRERVNQNLVESDDSDLDRIEAAFKAKFDVTEGINESLTEDVDSDISRIEAAFNAKFGNVDHPMDENLTEDANSNGLSAETIRKRLTDFAKEFSKLDLGK